MMAFSRSFRFPPALLALLGALALGACQSSSSPQQEQPKPPPAVEPVPTPERTATAAGDRPQEPAAQTAKPAAAAEQSGQQAATQAPAAAGATAEERVEALDRELETSYGAHDAMLREHQANARAEATAIAAEQPPGGRGTEKEGAEQGELYESLPGFGAPPPQGQQGDGAEATTAATGGEADEGKGGRTANAARAAAAGGQLAGATVPADIPDARDDDIVARQLREAAQMEKDPQLREKLWDEYRKYKNQQATR